MLMTEEQARTKWCPHARQADQPTPTFNRMEDGSAPHSCLCIASECMAWRGEKPREKTRNYHDAPTIKAIGGYNPHTYEGGWQYSHTDIDREGRKFDLLHRIAADGAPEVGYCAAFGKPGA